MDRNGIEKAVFEVSLGRRERLANLKEGFSEQVARLARLGRACYDSPLAQWTITVARVADSPLGSGEISAHVMNMRTKAQGSLIDITYFFTSPDRNYGHSEAIAGEVFRDVYTDDLGWQHNAFGMLEYNSLKSFINPQIEAMTSTADMLETAMFDESLGNDDVLKRYQQFEAAA